MARIFVTGGGGFVGREVVRTLLSRGHAVAGLVRSSALPPGAEPVHGDLLSPESYRQALTASDSVIHLAAATGKADAARHTLVNVEGTRGLVQACAAARRPVLFVSSVAVQYPDHSRYPYAAAKAAAEALVRESGTAFTIVRPTIVAGPGSPVLSGLARLASLPVVPVFGDGKTRVQPVDVEDVASVIADLVDAGRHAGETIGIGGPEVLTIEAMMLALREAAGRGSGRVVHLPLSLVLPALAAGERITGGRLPLTVGQLSLFRYDGSVAPHPVVDARKPGMQGLTGMLRRSLSS
jgi:nucleoside-diphosphate-sugar epimerase